jgi:Antitoxin VbhA
MAKPLSDQSSREKDVANTLASLRIENLSPSDSLRLGLQDYIEGKKTTEDLLTEVKEKYVALRRG